MKFKKHWHMPLPANVLTPESLLQDPREKVNESSPFRFVILGMKIPASSTADLVIVILFLRVVHAGVRGVVNVMAMWINVTACGVIGMAVIIYYIQNNAIIFNSSTYGCCDKVKPLRFRNPPR